MIPDQTIIAKAVELLRHGELVAFPTETVYGLGADASNADAIKKLYAAKGRPGNHPVIVHLCEISQLRDWARTVSDDALKLAKEFWPGPLTLILPKADRVDNRLTGGQDSVGLRMPAHPFALALLRAFGDGVAAPSANKFGRLSPTTAEDVRTEFAEQVSLVLDGGPCQIGIESTIVDLSRSSPVILRPGMIDRLSIESVIGPVLLPNSIEGQPEVTRAPGGLPSHYAPKTPLRLVQRDELRELLQEESSAGNRWAVMAFTSRVFDLPWILADPDPTIFARDLYANLRRLDRLELDQILVEQPPDGSAWDGIRDRLMRAATKEI